MSNRMLIAKDILYPGRWPLPDGRTFTCTDEDIRHFRRRMQNMLAAGLRVPLTVEHEDRLVPLSRVQWDKRSDRLRRATLGHVVDTSIGSRGQLVATFEVGHQADRLRVHPFASPFISEDAQDATYRKWPGRSILHVAATAVPVQAVQDAWRVPGGVGRVVTVPVVGGEKCVAMSLAGVARTLDPAARSRALVAMMCQMVGGVER